MNPAPSVATAALNPKRIFFSYGHDENRPIVERFKKDLEARGHRVWIDYERIGTWDEWRGRITEGILESEMAVAFLSVHSVRNPGVCRNEIAMALQRFGRVYPLLVEKLGCTADLPITLEHLQWPDLSGWRNLHDASERKEEFEKYYQDRLAEVIAKIEGDATKFKDQTEFLGKVLRPVSFDGRFTQHLDGFTGRRWLFDAFEDWSGRSRASRVFWLSAGPGFGKTAWTVNLAARHPTAVVATWFCQQGSRETTDPSRALMTLAFQLAQRLDDYRARLIGALEKIGSSIGDGDSQEMDAEETEKEGGAEDSENRDGLAGVESETGTYPENQTEPSWSSRSCSYPEPAPLRLYLDSKSPSELFDLLFSGPMSGVIPRHHKHVLLIDALDEASQLGGANPLADLLDNHLKQLPEWLGAIVTSRPDSSTIDRLGRYSPVSIEANDARNLEDLREIAQRILEGNPASPLAGKIDRSALVETLVRKSEGMVLYLQRIAEGIANGTLDVTKIDSIGSGVSGLESQYLRDFQHRLASGFEEKIQPILRLILGAPGDINEDFCAAVLGDKEDVRRGLIQLGSYIAKDAGQLRIYHKTLADWLGGERSSIFFTDSAKGRQQIAEFLWKCFAERDRDSEDKKSSLRCEDQVLAWLPELLPSLPHWRKAADLRAFGEFLNSRKHFSTSVTISGRAYRMRKREKGATHQYTLRAARAYGFALRESGDLEKAEPILREVLKIRLEQLGEGHNLAILAMESLAKLLYLKKSYSECISLRQRVCDLLASSSGADSNKTQSALYKLGIVEEVAGLKNQALTTFTRLLQIREGKFRFSDMRTLRVANRVAVIQRDSGDLESAKQTASRLVEGMECAFASNDSYLLTNRSLLGNIEEKIGNLEAAEQQYRLALTGRLANDPHGPSTILSLTRLASLLVKKKVFKEAADLLEQAWKSRDGIQSLEDRQGLDLLEMLAFAWNRTGRRQEALALMRHNLPFFENGDHSIRYNLSCYECLEGNLEEAKRLIADHLKAHPDLKEQALADSNFTAIRDFVEALKT